MARPAMRGSPAIRAISGSPARRVRAKRCVRGAMNLSIRLRASTVRGATIAGLAAIAAEPARMAGAGCIPDRAAVPGAAVRAASVSGR